MISAGNGGRGDGVFAAGASIRDDPAGDALGFDPMRDGSHEVVLHRASLVVDGAGVEAAPGVVLRRGATVLAAGEPQSIGALPPGARIETHLGMALLPPLGNAHVHLDLSELPAEPFDGDFAAWLARVRDFRRALDVPRARRSTALGAALCRAGGTALVGDIAGAPLGTGAAEVLRESGLEGVSFVEVFGVGATADAALRVIDGVANEAGRERCVHLGVQPHAPFSTSDAVVDAALRAPVPFSIHLAESADEVEFCRSGRGALRDMLTRFGAAIPDGSWPGVHPVDWFIAAVRRASPDSPRRMPTLVVHLNELEPGHAAALAALRVTAVYCPRASAYFGRRGAPWRELRAAGVRVALGTDGRLCLDTADRISTLDEIRYLARHSGATLREGLAMATVEVARALGVDEVPYTLAPGAKPGLLLVPCGDDPRRGVIDGDAGPQWLFLADDPTGGRTPRAEASGAVTATKGIPADGDDEAFR